MSDSGLVESLLQTGDKTAEAPPVKMQPALAGLCLVCAGPAQTCSQELLQQAAAILLGGPASAVGALCAPCSGLASQACHLHYQLRELDDRLRRRHVTAVYRQLGDKDADGLGSTKHHAEADSQPDSVELSCRLCPARLESAADLVRHLRGRHGSEPTAGGRPAPAPCAPCTHCRCGQSAGQAPEYSPAEPGHPPAATGQPPGYPPGDLGSAAVDGSSLSVLTAARTRPARPAAAAAGGQLACAACPQRFGSGALRRRHLRQAHPLLLAHACAICAKRFPSPSKLRVHEDSHAGARPHSCRVCGRRYLSAQKLHVHARSHTGERPFVCHMCGRTFAAAAYLVQHELTHTGRRPHQCHVCGKQFAQRGTMMKHVRSVHAAVVAQQTAAAAQQVTVVTRPVGPGPS